jgi:RNA polymerase sigma-70 factor (ECF subfamily)
MTDRTNEEWLSELRGPESAPALDDLRARLVRGLGYALAKQSNVTEADLEDFAQDALLRILDKLDTFRGESRFTTWAQKVAVRVAYSELRRRRWRDVSLQELIERQEEGYRPPSELADSTPSPEVQATQQMMLSEVERFIADELTDRQREALMAKMSGMPLEEVARRMDTNRNALYKLLHDARMRLRERMTAAGLPPEAVLAAFEG